MFRTQSRSRTSLLTAAGFAALAIASATGAPVGFLTSIAPYTVPVSPDYTIVAILSAGDRVPRTSNPLQQYQMVGIPDGLGAHANADGTVSVFMNHELQHRFVRAHHWRAAQPRGVHLQTDSGR